MSTSRFPRNAKTKASTKTQSTPARKLKAPTSELRRRNFLHSDVVRVEFERNMMEDELPTLRTAVAKEPYQTLMVFRKRRNEASALGARSTAKDIVAFSEQEMALYDRAATIWVAELGMFLQGLRSALADQLEREFSGQLANDLAEELRGDEYLS